tara:strand:+ start:4071 stop:4898 length:828 start_codon:yes stop_codon:yes gene_type:complete
MVESIMKIVYFGNNMFSSCLKYLIDEGHQILRVYKNKPEQGSSAITRLCTHNKIPLVEGKPKIDDLNQLVLLGAEMFIVAEYLHILPSTDVKYAMNIHPTLLPKGRGPTPLPYIIKHPETSGVTLHKISDDVDAGDIILQIKVPLAADESITTLMVKMHIEALNLIKTFFTHIDKYYDLATPQVNHSYWPSIAVLERVLDWDLPTSRIKLLIRSFGFFGVVVKLDNVLCRVCHIDAVEYKHSYLPGNVILEDVNLLVISSLDGIVCLHKASISEF